MIHGTRKLETLVGIGSILGSVMCVGIGVMDYSNGQSWKIWAVMTAVLVWNAVAMLRSAAQRPEQAVSATG
jgi:hypothetical protein